MAHKLQRWVEKVEEAVLELDFESKVAPFSAGDTKTILTRGVDKP